MGSLILKDYRAPLLAPFDLNLPAGECLTLTGPSGCGKSRLLRTMADLEPSQGQIWLNGQEKQSFSGPQWRSKVGLLMAESGWWSERVGDHFPNLEVSLFEQLGLPLEAADWEISRLSSGERQRLALIRLLTNQPQVLLLDEPTANLDHSNTFCVEEIIADWRQRHQTAVLWVTHDPRQQQRVGQQRGRIDQGQLKIIP
jgi:ABC-type iron transport system FetAB ATPase subunit